MAHAHRVSVLVQRLQKRMSLGMDKREFSTQILVLSRYIDHAVASNQKPISRQVVLQGLKQLLPCPGIDSSLDTKRLAPSSCNHGVDVINQGWFKQPEVDEFLSNFKMLFDFFLLNGECWKPINMPVSGGLTMSNENTEAETFIRMMCERYFPRLSLVSVAIALSAKPGYEARGCDFQITSQLAPFTKLRLFVCGKDNVETSACLVTPSLLSFLLNGRGVDKPNVAIFTCDDELIVGQSRVSLRCPISHKRIRTPVKGVSCKHPQVFDYDSYVEINDRRPSWRCPCCNTFVNCTEVRLDRQMQQVLKEVGENVCDVMINEDGSWTPAVSQDETDNAHKGSGDKADATLDEMGNVIINLSDGEDDENQDVLLTGQVPSREPTLPQVSPLGSTSRSSMDMEDRKPDIRSMSSSAPGACSASACAPISAVGANSNMLPSSGLSAIYTPIADTRGLPGPGNVTITRSVHEPQGGPRNMTQNPVVNSWTTSNNLFAPSLSTVAGLSSESRPSSERQPYPPPNRTPVIQALAAPAHLPTHFSNSNARPRMSPSLPLNYPLGQAGVGVSGSQLQNQSSSFGYELPTVQRTQASDMRAERHFQENQPQVYNTNPQGHAHLDSSQRYLRQGQRGSLQQAVMQNGHGNVRMQNFGSAPPYIAGQGHQFSNQLGQHVQRPLSATQQSATTPARQQIQLQEYLYRQRLAQQAQHPAQASASSRVSAGGGTSLNGVSLSSAVGVPSGGALPIRSHPVYPSRSHPTYMGGTNSEANNHLVTATSSAGVPIGGAVQNVPSRSHLVYMGGTNSVASSSLVTATSSGVEGWAPNVNWRPAGTPRMRGAVVGGVPSGLLPGRGVGLPSVTQPGTVNRTRVPPNGMNTTMPNPSNLVTSTHWGGGSSSAFGGGTSAGVTSMSPGGVNAVPAVSSSAVTASGSAELYGNAGPISTSALLPDISWPSLPLTQLESQLNSIGSQDSGFWIDDALFPSSHP